MPDPYSAADGLVRSLAIAAPSTRPRCPSLAAADREIDVVIEPDTVHGHLNRPHEPAASASIDRIVTRLAALRSPEPVLAANTLTEGTLS